MEDLVARLGKSSGKTRKDVQPDDVSRAIGKLAVLGNCIVVYMQFVWKY